MNSLHIRISAYNTLQNSKRSSTSLICVYDADCFCPAVAMIEDSAGSFIPLCSGHLLVSLGQQIQQIEEHRLSNDGR